MKNSHHQSTSESKEYRQDFFICSVIAAIYLLIGWFYWDPNIVRTPSKPDELEHLSYVMEVRDHKFWPQATLKPASPLIGDQRCQPPLYYMLAALVTKPTPAYELNQWVRFNPFFPFDAPANSLLAPYITLREYSIFLFSNRIFAWLLGVLNVFAVYHGAKVYGRRSFAILVTSLVSTLPSYMFFQTGVSCIALMVPLVNFIMGEILWGWRQGLTSKRSRVLAIALVLATYTRREALVLAVPLLFLVVKEAYIARSWEWRNFVRLFKMMVWFVGAFVAIAPLFIRNYLLYHNLFASQCLFEQEISLPWSILITQDLPKFFKATFISLESITWGFAPTSYYYLIILGLALGVLGWLSQSFKKCCFIGTPGLNSSKYRIKNVWSGTLNELGLILLPMSHALVIIGMSLEASRHYIIGVSRYIAASSFSWLMFWSLGYTYLWPRKFRRYGISLMLMINWFLVIMTILNVLFPLYVPEFVLSKPEAMAIFEDGIYLKEAHVSPQKIKAGDSVDIQLVWEASKPISRNYVVFVHALHPERLEIIAQQDTYPMGGVYPTAWWYPDRPFKDYYHLTLPADLDVTDLRLTVGLYFFDTWQRLPAFTPSGEPCLENMVPIGVISVQR